MSSSVRETQVPNGDDKYPNGDSQRPNGKFEAFAARLRSAATKLSFNQSALAKELGLTGGTLGRYWNGDRLPPSDTLIDLAETLGVSPAWLIRGAEVQATSLRNASDADWVNVPEFDLRTVTDTGKGEPVSNLTIRRDWLYLMLGESSNIWVARLLAPESALGMPIGAPIFCKDHPEGESPAEGQHYFFRVNGGIVLARFSFRSTSSMTVGDRLGEAIVTPADLAEGDHQHFIVARVLGALARPL